MDNYERPGPEPGGVGLPMSTSEDLAGFSGQNHATRSTNARGEDLHLVERLKLRDHGAMVGLLEQYEDLVYSVILRAVRNPATAEDLKEETFFRIWRRIHTFDVERGHLDKWVAAIARNIAIDHLRSLRSEPHVHAQPWDEAANPARTTLRNAEADRLIKSALC